MKCIIKTSNPWGCIPIVSYLKVTAVMHQNIKCIRVRNGFYCKFQCLQAVNSKRMINVNNMCSKDNDNKSSIILEPFSFDTCYNRHHLDNIKSNLYPTQSNLFDINWQFGNKYIETHAAVMIPLCKVNGTPSILFTVRSLSLNHHKGEVCFPGGKMDDIDENNVIKCALRESNEEIGISSESVEILGTLSPITINKNLNYAVHSVITYCGDLDPSSLQFNLDEVSEVIHFSIQKLCDTSIFSRSVLKRATCSYVVPEYNLEGYRIWGLTALILYQALKIISQNNYAPYIEPLYNISKL